MSKLALLSEMPDVFEDENGREYASDRDRSGRCVGAAIENTR